MSNSLGQSPAVITAAFNPGAASPNAIPPYALYVTKIKYTPQALGNQFTILNNAGVLKASRTAGPNDAGQTLQEDYAEGELTLNPQEGWYVSALGSGDQLQIYYDTYRV